MTNMVWGLKEGINFPRRKTEHEVVIDFNYWHNVMIVDIDYFISHIKELETSAQNLKEIESEKHT